MSPSVHLTVAAVICRQGRFLCVREFDGGKTVINQPAGHIEAGESILEAVSRETLEETGWLVEPRYFLSLNYYTSPGNQQSYHRIALACEPISLETSIIDPDIDQVLWLTQAQLRSLKHQHRSPMVLACIEDYLAGRQYPLEIIRNYR